MSRRRRLAAGAIACLIVVLAVRSLRDEEEESLTLEHLSPLTPLIGGRWAAEEEPPQGMAAGLRFTWAEEIAAVRELREEPGGEVLYFWHPEKESIAFNALLAGGELRQGILRVDPTDPDALELRWNGWSPDGREASYREILRLVEPDRLVDTVYLRTEEEESLEWEAVYLRR